MTILQTITTTAIDPALALLPKHMDTPQARVMLLTIGLQESRFEYRRQMGNGPAKGFWQFERGGGVKGCVNHSASAPHLRQLCAARGVEFTAQAIWDAIEHDDVLALDVFQSIDDDALQFLDVHSTPDAPAGACLEMRGARCVHRYSPCWSI